MPSKDQRHKLNKKGRCDELFVQYALISLLNVVQICKGINGNDALFGEGVCQAWVHQMCVGLTKQTYETLTENDSPYMVVSTL